MKAIKEEDFIRALREKINSDFRIEISHDPKILLQINNKHERDKTIKIHSCFINAPQNIIEAIARIILGKKKRYDRKKLIKYARETISSQVVKNLKIDCRGKFHNLKEIFDSLNREYFRNSISSKITYGKNFVGKRSRSIVFGNYVTDRNLIRINRALDNQEVPEFFVRYIVFHEMLHAHMYLSGTNCAKHSKRFKKKERIFPELRLAEKWKKENLHLFIQPKGPKNV
ncbi:MAG: SprT-like domain-containing protein [bacterium]|nr:SprT-like domain-containing protein [bacterium]